MRRVAKSIVQQIICGYDIGTTYRNRTINMRSIDRVGRKRCSYKPL